ncbi:multicopper oxidase family protein [Promicromonospora sp. NPDC090134]|uniref:multicopper oxidase family protein n=1 Tax=Promicromonospora sp. NPDC090134 TaxID=3364408 RepID=UPI00381D9F72
MSTDLTPATDGPAPIRISRRTLLLGLGAIGVAGAVGAGGYWLTEGRSHESSLSFTTPLRIPPLLESEIVNGERVFSLTAQAGDTQLVPGVRFSTMGFNGNYLGPTIRAARGEHVRVHVTNNLTMATTAHWHGMILPASQDGTPHQSIQPKSTWTAAWQIDQPAATLWYHPHPHGQTELQVGRGMAGLFLIDDDVTTNLPSDYGVDDIPLIIQDVTLRGGGTRPGPPTTAPIGRIGNTVIVNGTHQPHLRARSGLVRFRVLNASAARCYNLELSTKAPLRLIGTDGGLLPAPQPLTNLLLSPGERAEILIQVPKDADFVLRSVPHDLGMSRGDNLTSGADDTLDILRITRTSTGIDGVLPDTIPLTAHPRATGGLAQRHFALGDTTINDKTMDMDRIDTVVVAGSTENWTITNTSTRAHNFHIHGTQFIVDTINAEPAPSPNRGWKDTVLIAPQTTVELIVPFSSFADPTTPYMYHCHLLWHEDQGMMAQYVLTDEEHPRASWLPEHDEAHH